MAGYEQTPKPTPAPAPTPNSTGNQHILVIGNPGVGKSTLLNSLIGSSAFKSGISFMTGLTYQMDVYHDPMGTTYLDTPGLSDINMRKEAAKAIGQALRKGGRFTIIFAIKLDAGRARPQDLTTVRLVLDACPEIFNYGLIINQLEPEVKAMLDAPGGKDKFLDIGFPDPKVLKPEGIFLNLEDKDLKGKDNVLMPKNLELMKFVYQEIRKVHITPAKVKDINHDEYEKMQEKAQEMQEKMVKMENDMKSAQKKRDEDMAEMAREQKRRDDAHAAEVQRQEQIRRNEAAQAMEKQQERDREMRIEFDRKFQAAQQQQDERLKQELMEQRIIYERQMVEQQRQEAEDRDRAHQQAITRLQDERDAENQANEKAVRKAKEAAEEKERQMENEKKRIAADRAKEKRDEEAANAAETKNAAELKKHDLYKNCRIKAKNRIVYNKSFGPDLEGKEAAKVGEKGQVQYHEENSDPPRAYVVFDSGVCGFATYTSLEKA